MESEESLGSLLDGLLKRYLSLLDQYQGLRHSLGRHLSAGYFALAQANFSNPNRIRYGQDLYDDRMKASTHISVDHESPCFKIDHAIAATAVMPLKTSDIKEQSSEQLLKPDASNSDDRIQCSERNSDFLLDPLRWFGILVPPTLRDCQSSFKSAATDDIPRLASLVKDMKELEIEIRRARKKLRKAR